MTNDDIIATFVPGDVIIHNKGTKPLLIIAIVLARDVHTSNNGWHLARPDEYCFLGIAAKEIKWYPFQNKFGDVLWQHFETINTPF